MVIGHRPDPDPAPRPAGTTPGLRPPLLPAPPEADPVSTPSARSQHARLGRAQRLLTTRDRIEQLSAHNPEISSSWADTIAATDDAWTGGSVTWRNLATLDRPAPSGENPPPQPENSALTFGARSDVEPSDDDETTTLPDTKPAPKLWKPTDPPGDHPAEDDGPAETSPDDYGLAELDAELRDLVGDDGDAK